MCVCAQERRGIVAQAPGNDVQGNGRVGGKRDRGGRVTQNVQGARRDACGAACPGEAGREHFGADHAAELVAEDEVAVLICGAGDAPLELLDIAMRPE